MEEVIYTYSNGETVDCSTFMKAAGTNARIQVSEKKPKGWDTHRVIITVGGIIIKGQKSPSIALIAIMNECEGKPKIAIQRCLEFLRTANVKQSVCDQTGDCYYWLSSRKFEALSSDKKFNLSFDTSEL